MSTHRHSLSASGPPNAASTLDLPAPATIGVVAASSDVAPRAQRIAHQAGLPSWVSPPAAGLFLHVDSERVELRASDARIGPVYVDLIGGRVGRQRREPSGGNHALCRAFGLHRTKDRANYRIVDATAGLGRDAALLTFAGCPVHAIERHPALVAMLLDGLERACVHAEVGPWLRGRLEVSGGDARTVLAERYTGQTAPDGIYLDPMFPERRKRALVKKDMQLLQRLHGHTDFAAPRSACDEQALLTAARSLARDRVVVKRPSGAPPLAEGVTHRIEGTTVRYDVYLCRPPPG